MRNLIGDVLINEGHDILEAGDGAAGLEVIQGHDPDLIICDINMPKMTGDEMFDELRASYPEFSLTPFIFLSGNANEKEQIKRLNKGADHCFEKPFDMRLLVAHINSHRLRIRDLSNFVKSNLDRIASSLPAIIKHDFSSYEILKNNTNIYVEVITAAMEDNYKASNSHHFFDTPLEQLAAHSGDIGDIADQDIFQSEHNIDLSRMLKYVKCCLDIYKERISLVKTANGEYLSWELIFMVFEADLEQKNIFVSDLYVSIHSANSTINTRINRLIAYGILHKRTDGIDGRRQRISLTERFKHDFVRHINRCMDKMTRVNN